MSVVPAEWRLTRDTNNKPQAVSGWVVNSNDHKIVWFPASHEGMGSFVFVPEKGEDYRAVIDDFDGSPFKLPEAINIDGKPGVGFVTIPRTDL